MIKNICTKIFSGVLVVSIFAVQAQTVWAAAWNGIVPLKTSREDVEKTLGAPIHRGEGEYGTMKFKVLGGTVTVAFIDAKFVSAKNLPKDTIGKVRQIVLNHESSSETPESMKLDGKSNFKKEENGNVVVYKNVKDGIMYTFIDGALKTTYYVPSSAEISKNGGKYWIF